MENADIGSVCRHCGSSIEASHTFCPHCGRRLKGDPWYYHPAAILVLAFTVLGPFALLLLWKPTGISRPAKLIMAAVIVAFTVYLGYLVYRVTTMELGVFQQYNDLFRQIR